MKNVLILLGSPRKNGNTATMVQFLLNLIEDDTWRTTQYFLHNLCIKPCEDCRYCKNGNLECIQADDMKDIYKKLEFADIIIFATPIYWYNVTAQTKLVIDRLRPYFYNKKLQNKEMIVLLAAADGAKDAGLVVDMFQKLSNTLQMENLGAYTIQAYDEHDFVINFEPKVFFNDLLLNLQ